MGITVTPQAAAVLVPPAVRDAVTDPVRPVAVVAATTRFPSPSVSADPGPTPADQATPVAAMTPEPEPTADPAASRRRPRP